MCKHQTELQVALLIIITTQKMMLMKILDIAVISLLVVITSFQDFCKIIINLKHAFLFFGAKMLPRVVPTCRISVCFLNVITLVYTFSKLMTQTCLFSPYSSSTSDNKLGVYTFLFFTAFFSSHGKSSQLYY